MSIDKVEVTNAQGDLLSLSLEDISSGYIIEEITGLDPVKATISSSKRARMDGLQYQGSSREARYIVITLGYAPNYSVNETVRALRERLYDFFMTDNEVTLSFFMSDGLVVNTVGRVESCEAPLFTQEPQTNISITCFDPDFIDANMVEIHDVFTTTDIVPHPLQVDGTAKTGLTSLRFTAPKDLTEFAIYHTTPRGDIRSMLISAPILLGDLVEVCTVKGEKNVSITRGSVTSSILWAVSPDSVWVLLERGLNQLYVYVSLEDPAPVLVDFYNRYGGL